MSSTRESMSRARKSIAWPAGVSSTPRAVRLRSFTPNWSSSCAIRRLAAARAMWLAAAALVMLRVSAIRTKSARAPRSGRIAALCRPLGAEAPRRDGRRERCRERKRLRRELTGEELGAQGSPQQAAGAEAGRDERAGRIGRAVDRQAVRDRGAEP